MAKCSEFDLKCIRCTLNAAQWGDIPDCENCEYYMEKVLKGEIGLEEEEGDENEI